MRIILISLMLFVLLSGINNVAEGQKADVIEKFKLEKKVSSIIVNKKGIPTYIKGNLTPKGASVNAPSSDKTKELSDENSYLFFEENREIFKMSEPRKELKISKIINDKYGKKHVRLVQLYQGIDVIGGELITHYNANGELGTINGEFLSGINVQTIPTINSSDAELLSLQNIQYNGQKPSVTKAQLVIYQFNGSYFLSWLVKISVTNPPGRWDYFINAENGTVINKINQIKDNSFTVSNNQAENIANNSTACDTCGFVIENGRINNKLLIPNEQKVAQPGAEIVIGHHQLIPAITIPQCGTCGETIENGKSPINNILTEHFGLTTGETKEHGLNMDLQYPPEINPNSTRNTDTIKAKPILDALPDLSASRVYMRTATAMGGVEVSTPTVGQTVYFHFDYTNPSSLNSGAYRWVIRIDGIDFAYYDGVSTLAYNTYTGYCLGGWSVTAGNHIITAVVDVNNQVSEANEANNTSTTSFTSSAAVLPDLSATRVYMRTAAANGGTEIASPTVGQTVYFHFDYANPTSVNSGAYRWVIRIDGSDYCYYDGTGTLAYYNYTGYCLGGWVVTAGSHTITAVVDAISQVSESNENNNTASYSFISTAATLPDLSAVQVYMRTASAMGGGVVTNPTVGQTVYFHFDYSNLSSTTTGAYRWVIRIDGSDFAYYDGINALAYTNYTGYAYGGWTVTAGSHTITAVIDVNNQVTESNESNNNSVYSFTSSASLLPDLSATRVYMRTASASGGTEIANPTPGQTVYFHFDYSNISSLNSGAYRWVIRIDGSDYCYYDGTSVLAYSSYTGYCIGGWTVTAGNHILSAYVDVNSQVAESNEDNNLASTSFTSTLTSDADAIGTGIGVMGDTKNHIDTYGHTGSYNLIDRTRRVDNNIHNHGGQMRSDQSIETRLYPSATSLNDIDNIWNDAAQASALDAHVYAGLIYDYFLAQFDRNSFDNLGTGMISNVESNIMYNNAQYIDSQIIIYQVTSGHRSMAGAIDVVGHEWGHAITDFASGLEYVGESGALNESFSDMIGTAVGFGTGIDLNWQSGENFNIDGTAFRDLSNPHLHGQPDTYLTDQYWINVQNCIGTGNNDYCGVHTNSGVPNKMFYLLSQGGTQNGVTVSGLGISNAINIIYTANNSLYWNSTSQFINAKSGCIDAANDLDPTGNWAIQVRNAWEAVNVGVTPTAPVIGTITQPTCTLATGSVALSGLPATGTWTLTRAPGAITTTGTGLSTTLAGLTAGTYTFTVTNSSGGISASSANVVINAQPVQTAPTIGTITQPTCSLATGSVVLGGLPATGTWTLTRTPGAIATTGTGTTSTITGLAAGTYTYTVKNSSGCTSVASANLVINSQPSAPSAPTGTAAQSFCTGSTVASLVATGTALKWYAVAAGGTALATTTVLVNGTHYYASQTINTCESTSRLNITATILAVPTAPTVGTLTQPTCALVTGSVILNGLPASGTWTLTRTPGAITSTGTGVTSTLTGLATGTYTFTVKNSSGCSSGSSANVVINAQPVQTAPTIGTITQPTCALATGRVIINGLPATGTWTLTRTPGATVTTGTGTTSTISGLATGTYTYTVKNSSGCTSVASANVVINAQPSAPAAPTGTAAQSFCSGTTVASLVTTGTAIKWYAAATGGTALATTTVLVNGTHYYASQTINTCESSARLNVTATVNALPTAPAAIGGTKTVCVGKTTALSDATTGGVWSSSATAIVTISTTGVVTGVAAGTATITYKVTNASGCSRSVTTTVTINSLPTQPGNFTASTAAISRGTTSYTYTVPLVSGMTYKWSYSGTGATITGTTNSVRVVYATTATLGTLSVTATNTSGCVSVARTLAITFLKSAEIPVDIQSAVEIPVSPGDLIVAKSELKVYPNPTSGQSTFEFGITEDAKVTLDIYSMTGQHIARIFDASMAAGIKQKVYFDQNLSTGTYPCIMRWNSQMITVKLVITQ